MDTDAVPVYMEQEYLQEKYGNAVRKLGGKVAAVCSGMTKIVFIMEGGTALKIGYRGEGGLAGEINAVEKYKGIRCFPNMLSNSRKKNSSLVECVISDGMGCLDLVPYYGLNTQNVVYRIGGDERICFDNDSQKVPDDDPHVINFLRALDEAKGLEWDSLRDLRDYFRDEHPLDDIVSHNWGLALREGKKIPVVFDYDF